MTAISFLPAVASRLAVGLSTVALVAVPVFALLAIAWIVRPAHRALAASAIPLLLAIAWLDEGGLAGNGAALVLVALSAAAVAGLVVAVIPPLAAKLGIFAWAGLDLGVALSHRLEEASRPIMQAAPVVGPHLQFQRVVAGSDSMEWADFFLAALLGAVLLVEKRSRAFPALLVGVLALAFSTLFLVTDVLPATVPVALTLFVEEVRRPRPGLVRLRS